MLNIYQDFMGLEWRNNVVSLPVKDHEGVSSERAKSDEDRLINGFKWSRYDYFDQDQTDLNNLQTVPEIGHREEEEEENSKKDSAVVVVPDEHSETGTHHHQNINDYSDISDNRRYLRNKHDKRKRRRINQVSSDEESEEFTREVPNSVIRKGNKRRREEMSDKMRTLQQLVPNCHKTDNVSVLDKAIEYMRNLQLQLQVMSVMGMNSYFPPAMLDFGIMQNHLFTAAMAPVNQTASFPASNWPLTQFTNLSFPNSSTASTPQSIYGLVPCFPNFQDFSPHTIRRL